ncbi:MAG TPA: ABC transporter permease [Terriglobales bacterium]|jgi:predicted permease|nr:ABC transporter permease [Terriglobales bacterium]
METLLQDIRYGWRMLARNPGFTAIAVLTLAIGIGASTAIFSVVDTVLLRPLPYREPEKLVLVSETLPGMSTDEIGVSAGEYQDYRDRNRSFSQVAAYESAGFNLTGAGQPLRVNAAALSASAFPLLGVSPELGRGFTTEEDRYGSSSVVVLSHALWEHQYSRDPNILGQMVKLDEKPYTVIGVMPASFRFPFDGAPLSEMADLWVPLAFEPDLLSPENRTREFGVGLIGRLKPGVSKEQAQKDVENIAIGFMQEYGYSGTVRVVPKAHAFAGRAVEKARPLVILLILAVACVLIIACANVANLLLARASHRSREMAVRSAIGANPARLVRQCLVESVLLSVCGASAGVIVSAVSIAGLRRFGPADVPRLHDVMLHPNVLLFMLGLSVVTALLFGFVPAWRLAHVTSQACLKESTQAGPARGTQKLQNSVATVEIAAAMVLLIAGGLLLRSFVRLVDSPFGFDPRGVFVVRTLFDRARYPDPMKRQAAQKELLDRLSYLPGMTAVATASHLPLSDARQIGFRLEHAPANDYHWAENSLVSPGYFRSMGISLLEGRDFTEQDRPDTPNVAIISEKLAKEYFPGRSAVGQRFQWGDRAFFTITGVASDVHISALDADPPPMIYTSMFQVESGASGRTAFVLRGKDQDEGLFQEVQQQVWAVDKDLPIYNTTTLSKLVSESLAQRRFTVLLLGSFAVVAMLLAAIGLFGVISYLVAERTREFGVRMALGADRTSICWQVLKRAALLAAGGCGIGFLLSVFASRLLQASLYQVSRFDWPTLVFVPFLLLTVALFAAYWPARRATKVDPVVALRYE